MTNKTLGVKMNMDKHEKDLKELKAGMANKVLAEMFNRLDSKLTNILRLNPTICSRERPPRAVQPKAWECSLQGPAPSIPANRIICQHVCPVATANPIVLVSQGWPCWLLTVLALNLPLAAVFVPPSFRQYFSLFDIPVPWLGLDDWTEMSDWPGDWDSYFVLASGSPTFAHNLSTKLKGHHKGILLYAADIIF
jgi:hypothetical protein